ncbi:nucleoside phosphorylase, putative [Bodo saltans]|uniref:Nucleoside phosphorylase, putative n=1 Tax=Bodo saltans TaxID=75058 RepID=A0A0S4JKY9_BODSA|nr:nucleoside phosphorylase, putative [Bodo saltans]|eukprot:CUG90896.1 nucleoside phosphorylase, putative [Bodo saltans]
MPPQKRPRSSSPASPKAKTALSSPAAAVAAAAAARASSALGAASPKKFGSPVQKALSSPVAPPALSSPQKGGKKAAAPAVAAGSCDPDLPMTPDGVIYHLACKSSQLADKIVLVGDPGRVEVVAAQFDKNSITFRGSHREINIITGKYKGTPVSCLSTGMGTDNVEIVINEIHALKEYNITTHTWLSNKERKPGAVHLIRIGTCGSPRDDVSVGTLAVSNHAIGMDNTCRYYQEPEANKAASVKALAKAANATQLGSVGVYATKAHQDVVDAIVNSVEAHNKSKKAAADKQAYVVGTTASGSGFYGCQGRAVGQFRGRLTVPDLVDELGSIRFPVGSGKNAQVEKVVNIEMENSALCYLSNALGYKAGTVCAIIARRAGALREFATPEVAKRTLANAIVIALDALVTVPAS